VLGFDGGVAFFDVLDDAVFLSMTMLARLRPFEGLIFACRKPLRMP